MANREKYYLGADGVKYARHNMLHNIHPHGTKMYCTLGSNRLEPMVYDLPQSAIPWTMLYEDDDIKNKQDD